MRYHQPSRNRFPSSSQFSDPRLQYSEQGNRHRYIRPVNPPHETGNLRHQHFGNHNFNIQNSNQNNIINQNVHPRAMMTVPPRLPPSTVPPYPRFSSVNMNQEHNIFPPSHNHEESVESNYLKQNVNMLEPGFSQSAVQHKPWENSASAEYIGDISRSQKFNPSQEMVGTLQLQNFRSINLPATFQPTPSSTCLPGNTVGHSSMSSHYMHQISGVEKDFERENDFNYLAQEQKFTTKEYLPPLPSVLPVKQQQHPNFASTHYVAKPSHSENNEQQLTTCSQIDVQSQDIILVENWLKFKDRRKETKESSRLLIPEAKSLLKGTISMLHELKATLKNIKEEENSELIHIHFQRAEEMKVGLDEMKKVIGSSTAQDVLKQRAIRAKKKRERLKRKRKQQYDIKMEALEKRKQLHSVIDIWQEGIANKVQEKKREKELKTIADKTLAEVRHKTTDVKKSLEVLQSLRKLRSVRKDSKERKGLYTSKESDHMFEARLRMLTEFLEKQLQTYEAEKSMIQVMLDTEEAECQEYEQEELKRSKEEKEKQLEKNIKMCLFGKQTLKGPPSPTHPLYNFYMYYDAANHSVDSLCAIRHDWDQFLVNEYSTEGSTVPSTWITPSKPSSDVWASALKS